MKHSFSILVLVLYVTVTSVSTKSVTPHRKKSHKNSSKGNRLTATEITENETPEEERWLVDEIDYPAYDYQGDAPGDSLDNAKCPPYPEKQSIRACRARECKTDRDCRRSNQRCCFNGCKFTCTMEMTEPAVVDWRRPPRRQSHSGTSWLVRESSEDEGVEPCTTTRYPDDGDPLLCPHGYICHIVEPGDPETGIPNRGQCIADKQDEDKKRSRQKILGPDLRRSGMCRIGLTVIRDQTVLLRGDKKEKCICQRGTILCGDKFREPTSGR